MAKDSVTNHAADRVEDQNVGRRCEARVWQQRYKRDGTRETVAVESLTRENNTLDKAYAIVVNQAFSERNRLDSSILTVNSAYILQAFRDVIRSYPTVAADFSQPFDMESPFQMLYHYWDDLDAYRESLDDDDARMHLNLLLDFMEADMGPEKARCETQVKKGQVDYNRLWTIYRPGDLQVRFENGHPWLLRMVKTAYEENTTEGKWMEVHCTYTDYDGVDVGEAKQVFKIHQKRYFASENPANIVDLVVYPRKFLREDDRLETRLTECGKYFLTLQGTLVRQYDGMAEYIKELPLDYFHPNMADFESVWLPYKESGRVVIDRKTFQEENHLSQVAIKPDPTTLDQMLCPPFVYGFSLAKKEWCRFYLPQIQEIDWKTNGFDSLVMKESQKTLLRALVSSHSFPDNPRDQMQQKGKGLVILLHGTPGSGKTLTAECAAEMSGKALFSTSMAELNKHNRAWYFEHRLSQVLQYATIWKAIVLLDEADVFLEARKDDVPDAAERNALVAVFLRHLEYFSGIVFLTTNRIHVFDPAMISRIHLTLGYSPPAQEMRRLIWTQSLQALPPKEVDMNQIDGAINDLIREKLNGREITNAINTARTLARYEGKPLQLSHIETVLGIRKEFNDTLKKMAALAMASDRDPRRGSMGPLVRQGSLLGAMTEEPDDLE
jgi:AAA+ superfamily predicted ATPase